jgi:hypothetical protein
MRSTLRRGILALAEAARPEHPRSGPEASSQRRPAPKEPPPGGFLRKGPTGVVAPQSETAPPSSRLAIQPFPKNSAYRNSQRGSGSREPGNHQSDSTYRQTLVHRPAPVAVNRRQFVTAPHKPLYCKQHQKCIPLATVCASAAFPGPFDDRAPDRSRVSGCPSQCQPR